MNYSEETLRKAKKAVEVGQAILDEKENNDDFFVTKTFNEKITNY